MDGTNRCLSFAVGTRSLGSARDSRASFGALAETIFLQRNAMGSKEEEKVRDDGDVIASTRGRVRSPERCRRVIFIYQMNSEPNIATPGVSDPGYRPAIPQPFYWSVRRELWENRSIYVAPILVAIVVLFGFLVSTIGLPERRRDSFAARSCKSARCNRSAV